METKIEINIIVWSTNIELATKYAEIFTQGTKNQAGFFTNSSPEYILNTFTRCPNVQTTATPSSITDIVMVVVENAEESEAAQKYLDSRRGIPFKVCLTTQVGQFEELECKSINPGELANERTNVIKEALSFEKTLVNVFKKFDLNGNGLISTDELISCSKELGHELSKDDAKMITDTLDKDKKGNIDFNGFKRWWVTGKSDFTAFRRIVKAEMSVNKLIKMTSKNFNEYLSNLNENSNELVSQEIQQNIDINLHSGKEFENGVGLFIDISSGNEAKEIMQGKPENIRNSPVFVSLNLEMENNQIASETAEMLNQMINPMLEAIPEIASPIQMGGRFNIRANQNKLIADITVQDMLAEIFMMNLNMYNTKEIKMSGEGTWHLFSALNIGDIYKDNLNPWELFEKAMNMKMHIMGRSYNLRGAVEPICAELDNQINSGVLPPKMKKISMGIRALSILREFTLDFNFDPTMIVNILFLQLCIKTVGKEGYNGLGYEEFKKKCIENPEEKNQINDKVRKIRETISTYLEMGEQMKESIPPEFIDIIKAVNLEKIELQFGINTEQINSSSKFTLNLPGLNEIKDKILN